MALQTLLSGEKDARKKVEQLLGFGGKRQVTDWTIAQSLGISHSKVRYWTTRDSLLRGSRILGKARKEAAMRRGAIVTSNKLGFSIWLPEDWGVQIDTNKHPFEQVQDCEQREARLRRARTEQYSDRGLRKSYRLLQRAMKDAIIPLDEYGMRERAEKDGSEESFERRMRRMRAQGRCSGYWRASPKVDVNHVLEVEVSKFAFRSPLTAGELYQAEKPEQSYEGSANRSKMFSLDGLEAIRHYYVYPGPEGNAVFITYMTIELTGWSIHCWYDVKDSLTLRPLFHRIVSSFHRL